MTPFVFSHPHKPLIRWLLLTCLLVWAMIVLGGATRLTHSGLSIVEWKPVTGIIPPLSEHDWSIEFDKYKLFPEYQQVNGDMSLSDFKFIYWMEFAHRLLGRLLGLFFVLPLFVFWARGQLPYFVKRRSMWILLVGAAQGAMGWYMVKSGLVKDPAVSHLRLTAHLGLAFLLFSLLLWTAFDLTDRPIVSNHSRLHKLGKLSCFFLICTIAYGGLVAGLKAGLIYNTFPLMGGQWIPSEWLFYEPLYKNFVDNQATVQFMHRWLAIFTFLFILYTTHLGMRTSSFVVKKASFLWISAASLQVILGVWTLLYAVPVSLGTLHQGTAVLVFSLGLWFVWLTKRS